MAEYTDEQLDRIQQEIVSGLDKEDNLDREIEEKAHATARDIVRSNKSELELLNFPVEDATTGVVTYHDALYRVRAEVNAAHTMVTFIFSDIDKENIAGTHYVPHICYANVDNSFSLEENYIAAISDFIRYKYGKPRICEIGDFDGTQSET